MSSKRALLVDDEPDYQYWLIEFLEAQGLTVDSATTLTAALSKIDDPGYAVIIVDLNIPAFGAAAEALSQRGPLVAKYPGLYVAHQARNRGYSPTQVISFTVHDDRAVGEELRRIDCRYVLKGRPGTLKATIRATLERH